MHQIIAKGAATMAVLISPALTAVEIGLHCRNPDLEIRCFEGSCDSSDDFTPMHVVINTDNSMSICAYSGCWEGPSEYFSSGTFEAFFAHQLSFLPMKSASMNADFAVVFDYADEMAIVKGFGFAMPMQCEPL
ncbi:hypothetical protein [Echinimonas agarilytica]|uniref:Uncharacterized protein n=1 Tax=Echinimonas agarilytica TaxID=1215918 RepID=A0AA42B7P0_9GAMM|nr:hypothetical protein [Echinimonas agarilytica]MCM2679869.1 hypothetical protein [Echinimonas agarilytica]